MSGDSGGNDEFYEQLRLQQIYDENVGRDDYNNPRTYTDQSDGTEYEWDHDKKAWFPKLTEDFLAAYQATYGFNTEDGASANAHTSQTESMPSSESSIQKPTDNGAPPSEQKEAKQKGEKRKAEPGWFEVEEKKNTNVYVSDITSDEFVEVMSKCGIIMRDCQTEEYKVKLYKDKDGNLKGDGLCCYLKRESVELALKLLDEYDIRGYKIHIEVAKFQLKGQYDAKKKKKKIKDYKKRLLQQQKQLDWRPEKKLGTSRLRHERVLIIKNMFHPKEFEDDPLVLNEIREDLQTECEKFGQVKKILVFDRHPDGVASVSFKEAEEGDSCKKVLNGRWFGGRQLIVETWDGVTDYQIEETSREREERLKVWGSYLESESTESKTAIEQKTETAISVGENSSKDHLSDGVEQKAQEEEENRKDNGNESTDSSLAGSDDEIDTEES
ncbi:HIV Tat-specific factor 1 isoform X2 [Latimeria chalumnae]|uniref:HIV Tat-specific factor 1 isoform X2 n=1 Tax=Latimeria chalumnae TaxID=7897 RepID=UPI00313D601B